MRDRPTDAHTKALAVKAGEIRHHLDEDKSNNAPANLTPMSRSAHTTLHNKTRVLGRLRKALSMPARKEKLY
jgi:hypothetical protein